MNLEIWHQVNAIVFDLDGVLVDSRHLHYEALNAALREIDPSYVITVEEHLAKYDGCPTKQKLERLTLEKGLPEVVHSQVWKRKQDHTEACIYDCIKPNPELRSMLETLRHEGYRLFCCSNSIQKTLHAILTCLNILELFEHVYSNEDVQFTKPHPQIYMKCFTDAGLVPQQVLVVEDSPIGRVSATLSGAHVCPVAGPEHVTASLITKHIAASVERNRNRHIDTRWNSQVQVVIPMAGAGSRFSVAGYDAPKPLIDIDGKPMIQWVIDNLNLAGATYIFIVRTSHLNSERWKLREVLELHAPGCIIISTNELTDGPVCSVLLAKDRLIPDIPLLIANSDQFLEWDANAFLYKSYNVDGCISVFDQPDPTDRKWSYARVDDDGMVTEVREKDPISTYASTGIYYWTRASYFMKYAQQMIDKNLRVNNEFYVCPVYNEAIRDGKIIKVSKCKRMWGLGVPADLEEFMKHYLHL